MGQILLFPGKVWQTVTNPIGWSWAHGLTIQRKGSTFRAKGLDISSYAPTGKAYYVSTTGNDLATGLNWANSLRSIDIALAKVDIDICYIEAGTYLRTKSWDSYDLARSVSIVGVGGGVICTNAQDGLVWALSAGQTNTYETTRSSATKVLDVSNIDSNDDYQEPTLQTSIATVEANAGSYWINGNLVYVHTFDNRVPDSNIWVTLTARNAKISGDVHIYCENIDFVGGYAGLEFDNTGANQTPEFYAKNCKFRHTAGNGLEITGQSKVILQDCLAAKNSGDGFNYHVLNGVVPKVIEINCISRNNGVTGDEDNGSTVHDGGSVIRLNGQYYLNRGPNVVDSAALESWNLGCIAHNSQTIIPGAAHDFNAAGGSGVMWLDRCVSYGSTYGITAGANTTIYKRKCSSTIGDGGAGIVTTY